MVLVASLALTGAVLAAQAAPSDLTAEQEGKDVRLRWTPGTDEEYIGQWVNGWEDGKRQSLRSWMVKKDLDNVIYSYENDMEFGKTYKFRITGAVREEGSQIIGDKGYSNVATLTLVEPEPTPAPQRADPPPAKPQPTNLQATTSEGEVRLTWTLGTDKRFVAQEVKRRVMRSGRWKVISRIDKETAQYVDTTVTPGQKYRYRVKGVRDNGKGRISKQVTIVAE